MANRKANFEEDLDVVTSIRVPRSVHNRFRAIAAAEHRTVSQELRRLIEQHVASYEAEEAQVA